MSAPKNYSPAPWQEDDRGHVVDAEGQPVVLAGFRLPTGSVRGPEHDRIVANTTLALVAPELLAALKELAIERHEDGQCWCGNGGDEHASYCRMARAAIAKAEGRAS